MVKWNVTFVALAASLLLLFCSRSDLHAGERWALLIGVDKCRALGELKVCAADAIALKHSLEEIGFQPNHISLLVDNTTDVGTWPTLANVESAIERTAQVAGPDDLILVFFSGHGVTREDGAALVPCDGDRKRGIALNWVKDQLGQAKAKEKILVLDACHSGAAAKGVSSIVPDVKTDGNVALLLSCDRDQLSWPDDAAGHSVFTSALLTALRGQTAEPSDKIMLNRLADHVQRSVKEWTFSRGKPLQTPIYVPPGTRDIWLGDYRPGSVPEPTLVPPSPDGAAAPVTPVAAPIASIPANQPQPADGKDWTVPDLGMAFVWLPTLKLWAGKYEVTNAEYRRFKPDHDSKEYQVHSLNGDQYPVVLISYNDALAFVRWLTQREQKAGRLPLGASYRLPTRAEWQSLARCGDTRRFPWGDTWPPKWGNYSDQASAWAKKVDGYTDSFPVTSPVDKSGGNEWGLFGLGGNVWEFTCKAPDGPVDARCGGCWSSATQTATECATAESVDPAGKLGTCGFRLVLTPP